MSSAQRSTGFVHQSLVFSSEAELLAAALPFLRAGLDAGHPTLLDLGPEHRDTVLDALGRPDELTLVPARSGESAYTCLRDRRRLITDLVAAGAEEIRVVGSVPQPGASGGWHDWVRYEAACNHVLAELPLSGICVFDRRKTTEAVLADVAGTHPHVATANGPRPGSGYVEPGPFLAGRAHSEIDPLERSGPNVELDAPSAAYARNAVVALAAGTDLSPAAAAALGLAVAEIVANAIEHGRPPVRLRAWASPERLAVAVRDRGPGPEDPFAGIWRDPGQTAALGLHVAYQSGAEVTLDTAEDAFTVHLVMRAT